MLLFSVIRGPCQSDCDLQIIHILERKATKEYCGAWAKSTCHYDLILGPLDSPALGNSLERVQRRHINQSEEDQEFIVEYKRAHSRWWSLAWDQHERPSFWYILSLDLPRLLLKSLGQTAFPETWLLFRCCIRLSGRVFMRKGNGLSLVIFRTPLTR